MPTDLEATQLVGITTAAAVFSKNHWEPVSEDEAYVLAATEDGQSARLAVRVVAHRGVGTCDIEARTAAVGELTGVVSRVQLYIDWRLAADLKVHQRIEPHQHLTVRLRIIVGDESHVQG